MLVQVEDRESIADFRRAVMVWCASTSSLRREMAGTAARVATVSF
jgi:hypothetical protein